MKMTSVLQLLQICYLFRNRMENLYSSNQFLMVCMKITMSTKVKYLLLLILFIFTVELGQWRCSLSMCTHVLGQQQSNSCCVHDTFRDDRQKMKPRTFKFIIVILYVDIFKND